jgi:hypothetical protein
METSRSRLPVAHATSDWGLPECFFLQFRESISRLQLFQACAYDTGINTASVFGIHHHGEQDTIVYVLERGIPCPLGGS